MSDKIKKIIDAFGMGLGCLLIAVIGIMGFGTIFGAIVITVWENLTR